MAQESPEYAPPAYLKTHNQNGNRGAALTALTVLTVLRCRIEPAPNQSLFAQLEPKRGDLAPDLTWGFPGNS
jgi:hypothetical protein